MADFDIYDDLDDLHAQQKEKAVEEQLWKEKYQAALVTIEKLQTEKKELNKKIKHLETNFSNLLQTARAEIKRKDNQIAELRREKDDICFRRNVRPVKRNERSDGENTRNEKSVAQHSVPSTSKQAIGDNRRENRNEFGGHQDQDQNREARGNPFKQKGDQSFSQERSGKESSDSNIHESENKFKHQASQRNIPSHLLVNSLTLSKANNLDKIEKCGNLVNTNHQLTSSMEDEILKDVKRLRKERMFSDSIQTKEPKQDPLKLAEKKSYEFFDAVFDDMVENEGMDEVELYDDLVQVGPMDKSGKTETNSVEINKSSQDHPVLATPTKPHLTKVLNELFGPSPDGSFKLPVAIKNALLPKETCKSELKISECNTKIETPKKEKQSSSKSNRKKQEDFVLIHGKSEHADTDKKPPAPASSTSEVFKKDDVEVRQSEYQLTMKPRDKGERKRNETHTRSSRKRKHQDNKDHDLESSNRQKHHRHDEEKRSDFHKHRHSSRHHHDSRRHKSRDSNRLESFRSKSVTDSAKTLREPEGEISERAQSKSEIKKQTTHANGIKEDCLQSREKNQEEMNRTHEELSEGEIMGDDSIVTNKNTESELQDNVIEMERLVVEDEPEEEMFDSTKDCSETDKDVCAEAQSESDGIHSTENEESAKDVSDSRESSPIEKEKDTSTPNKEQISMEVSPLQNGDTFTSNAETPTHSQIENTRDDSKTETEKIQTDDSENTGLTDGKPIAKSVTELNSKDKLIAENSETQNQVEKQAVGTSSVTKTAFEPNTLNELHLGDIQSLEDGNDLDSKTNGKLPAYSAAPPNDEATTINSADIDSTSREILNHDHDTMMAESIETNPSDASETIPAKSADMIAKLSEINAQMKQLAYVTTKHSDHVHKQHADVNSIDKEAVGLHEKDESVASDPIGRDTKPTIPETKKESPLESFMQNEQVVRTKIDDAKWVQVHIADDPVRHDQKLENTESMKQNSLAPIMQTKPEEAGNESICPESLPSNIDNAERVCDQVDDITVNHEPKSKMSESTEENTERTSVDNDPKSEASESTQNTLCLVQNKSIVTDNESLGHELLHTKLNDAEPVDVVVVVDSVVLESEANILKSREEKPLNSSVHDKTAADNRSLGHESSPRKIDESAAEKAHESKTPIKMQSDDSKPLHQDKCEVIEPITRQIVDSSADAANPLTCNPNADESTANTGELNKLLDRTPVADKQTDKQMLDQPKSIAPSSVAHSESKKESEASGRRRKLKMPRKVTEIGEKMLGTAINSQVKPESEYSSSDAETRTIISSDSIEPQNKVGVVPDSSANELKIQTILENGQEQNKSAEKTRSPEKTNSTPRSSIAEDKQVNIAKKKGLSRPFLIKIDNPKLETRAKKETILPASSVAPFAIIPQCEVKIHHKKRILHDSVAMANNSSTQSIQNSPADPRDEMVDKGDVTNQVIVSCLDDSIVTKIDTKKKYKKKILQAFMDSDSRSEMHPHRQQKGSNSLQTSESSEKPVREITSTGNKTSRSSPIAPNPLNFTVTNVTAVTIATSASNKKCKKIILQCLSTSSDTQNIELVKSSSKPIVDEDDEPSAGASNNKKRKRTDSKHKLQDLLNTHISVNRRKRTILESYANDQSDIMSPAKSKLSTLPLQENTYRVVTPDSTETHLPDSHESTINKNHSDHDDSTNLVPKKEKEQSTIYINRKVRSSKSHREQKAIKKRKLSPEPKTEELQKQAVCDQTLSKPKSTRSSSLEKSLRCTPTHQNIYQDDISSLNQSSNLPSILNISGDAKFQEIDKRMRSLFQSPTYPNETSVTESKENITINETQSQSEQSTCDTSSSSRRVSLGSCDYIIEKVSANTANVFIKRKKCKKRMKVAVAAV